MIIKSMWMRKKTFDEKVRIEDENDAMKERITKLEQEITELKLMLNVNQSKVPEIKPAEKHTIAV